MWHDLLVAFALVLVLEGIVPFLNPGAIRRAMLALAQMNDSTLRFGRPHRDGGRLPAALRRPLSRPSDRSRSVTADLRPMGSRTERWLLPEGMEELVPPESLQLERIRRSLLDLFDRWGYEIVTPPLIEYLESLLTGTGEDLELHTFKLIDQLTGRMMGVRADMTPQVARIDAAASAATVRRACATWARSCARCPRASRVDAARCRSGRSSTATQAGRATVRSSA